MNGLTTSKKPPWNFFEFYVVSHNSPHEPKLFAIPWHVLHWTRDKNHYVLNVDKTVLKDAPGFDKKHWPHSSNTWDQLSEELNQFYRVTP